MYEMRAYDFSQILIRLESVLLYKCKKILSLASFLSLVSFFFRLLTTKLWRITKKIDLFYILRVLLRIIYLLYGFKV